MSQGELQALQKERSRKGIQTSLIGVALNLLVAVAKIVGGMMSGAVSVIADGVNNLSDAAASTLSLTSLLFARKPSDSDHPFGHGRLEYLGALAVGVIIVWAGLQLGISSVRALLQHERPVFSWLVFGLTALTLPVKAGMVLFYDRVNKKYDIKTVAAAKADAKGDLAITTGVLLGLAALKAFGWAIDAWLGLAIALFIVWNGFQVLKETVSDLIGRPPDAELVNKIFDILGRYPEIVGTHDFVLHDYGPGRRMASVHAEVRADQGLMDIHDIVDQAERHINSELGIPICIHMDPVVDDALNPQSPRARIAAFLKAENPALSMHEFRAAPGKRVYKLIFDLGIPADYKDAEGLLSRLDHFVKTINPKYECVVRFERGYFDA